MDVIPTDANLVRGSHGAINVSSQEAPIFITQKPNSLNVDTIAATDVCKLLLQHLVE